MQLKPVLNRMAQEGWIKRKSGNGWFFTELIESKQAHEDSYFFRMTIEPAALLAPGFSVDSAALQRLRAEQTALRDGRLGRITSEELFEIGARFHETLIAFSGNEFFVAALARVNQRRRLVEYEAMAHPADFIEQCHEHLALLDLIEQGHQQEAAAFLLRHLDIVRGVKLRGVSQANLIPHF
jgi:DNA-binding GntR family transcriptional regulator